MPFSALSTAIFEGVFGSHAVSDFSRRLIGEFHHGGSHTNASKAVSWGLLPNYLGNDNENNGIRTEKKKKENQILSKSLKVYSQRPGRRHLCSFVSICVEKTGSSVVQGTACSSSCLKSAPKPSLWFCHLPPLRTFSSLDLKPQCAADRIYIDFSICCWVVPWCRTRINQKKALPIECISKIKRKY